MNKERNLKLALFGYGKMGKMVEKLAADQGHQIADIKDADVAIDFSHANCVLNHVSLAAAHGKNIVIGTTGWQEQMDHIKSLVQQHSIGLLYSPNFSLGIHLFMRLISDAARIFEGHPQFDIAGIEAHHKLKADSPSGTAKAIIQRIKESLPEKEISFSSVRCGDIPGTHSLIFDSLEDTITITHTARNREGFAKGALAAAKWLIGKKGVFTLDDLFKESKN